MKKLSPDTIRKARERQANLVWFFETTKWARPLESIRTQNLEDMGNFLRNKTDWHWNTVSNILNFVKEVVGFGMAEGLIPTRPMVLRVIFIETEHQALNADQVRIIAEREWKNPELHKAVDCFLFQCYIVWRMVI